MDKKNNEQERVSSPAELNDYIRVSSPAVWIVLGIVAICLAAFIVWGFFGTVDAVDEAGSVVTVHPISFVIN